MTGPKRAWPGTADGRGNQHDRDERPLAPTPPARKRRRVADTVISRPTIPARSGRDLLSPLSDELLLRILSFLPLQHLLAVAPVSRRFYQLASDSQLWKALYYARFVLPRALRIPGFRDSLAAGGGGGGGTGHKLHYSGRRILWGEGGRARRSELGKALDFGRARARAREEEECEEDGLARAPEEDVRPPQAVNWKRQYKIRHNWARGKCAVEELKLGGDIEVDGGEERRMLVKVVEGVAVTADKIEGLRVWDLRSRVLIAQIDIGDQDAGAAPSCIAVDDREFEQGVLDVALGFADGSFGVWRLFAGEKRLARRYRHEKSSNGELIAMAFAHPYLLTATKSVLISLYTFDVPSAAEAGTAPEGNDGQSETEAERGPEKVSGQSVPGTPSPARQTREAERLSAPYLLTSLDSHTSRPPLALSIRNTAATTIASVAYTFSTLRGWSIGIQDLHIHQSATGIKSLPEITTTRIAYTTPVEAGVFSHSPLTPPATPRRRGVHATAEPDTSITSASGSAYPEPGPTTLCYTHPYLLATLPDNTLVLHLCTSNASSLSISHGIRLWGHTSGISDAEITARGKAVSVSCRGEEMRVWELEGRSAGIGSRSVEIRPWQSPGRGGAPGSLAAESLHQADPARDWDERRNWVGFDDEMVIVLRERRGARASLMVYDFT
ncbi:hypothetical protein VTK56DRAFT_8141 [Thermocarpiscus australiensis]